MNRITLGLLCLVCGVAGLVAVWMAVHAIAAEEQQVIRYDLESRYYKIRVVDYPAEGRRCLHFSKSRGIQSSMFIDDPVKLDLRYSKSMIAAFALHPAPKEVLLIGLGGAAIPKFVQKHFPDTKLDIVEIDPDVVKVCQDFFEFKGTPNTRVTVMDGRMYLKRLPKPKKYDLILLDAYAADRVPFHLCTLEFVQLVRSRLNDGGVVASNLWESSCNRFYLAELKTFQATFPRTYLNTSGDSGNIIVFGTLDKKEITKDEWARRAEALPNVKSFGFDLPAQIRSEYEHLTTRIIPEKALTDDMAPVDTLRHENPKYYDKQ